MRRREFIAGLGCAALAPIAARAQQSMPVVGWLNPRSAQTDTRLLDKFRRGLMQMGFVVGSNVALEYRRAAGHYDQLLTLAKDLVSHDVKVIVVGSPPGVLAAKAATTSIPIVFASGGDPVRAGFVESLSHPGGNITGIYMLATELEAKRIELLKELVGEGRRVAVLVNPTYKEAEAQVKTVQSAARSLDIEVDVLLASAEADLIAAFDSMTRKNIRAFLTATDPFFNSHHKLIAELAEAHRLLAVYPFPEYVRAGGLASYGASIADAYYQCGIYAGRILSGAKPADLPVQQSTKIELVLNLKTARTLGLAVPPTLLARADEVIE
jgi:putative ABC transport system substrate-binding protein